jgi:preprotein translocase subunit YajC
LIIYSTAPYACILGSRNRVRTDKGLKQICSINIGDKVLTQAGTYEKVININSFPAIEKPNCVEIKL